MKKPVEFSLSKATRKDVLNHLRACNAEFSPPLSSRVDLVEYAEKIFTKAVRFEAWAGTTLVGLLAIYVNNDNHMAFVTNVSVLADVKHRGIATTLGLQAIHYAKNNAVNSIALEVSEDNTDAINLYKKLGFTIEKKASPTLTMHIHLA